MKASKKVKEKLVLREKIKIFFKNKEDERLVNRINVILRLHMPFLNGDNIVIEKMNFKDN